LLLLSLLLSRAEASPPHTAKERGGEFLP
jgi:hypothetical protein